MSVKKSKEYILAKIKVVGVGGGGGNAITRMAEEIPKGIELIAINTDIQDLNHTKAKKKIHVGKNLTRGLGTGMNPEIGRQAAEENRSEITDALKGADMIFIAAGFGGGTGTGAGPIVAEVAKELGILTVAVVTRPFSFEGAKRGQIAHEGIIKLRDKVDTLITIPNDKIFSLINKDTSLLKAFEAIDEVLKNSVCGITELIMAPGIINVDFADVKTIMEGTGSAVIGIGKASGKDRAVNAANAAINSPLIESSIEGAKGVLFSVSGKRDLKMSEVNDVARIISDSVDPAARIIFGAYNDRDLEKGQIKVTLVATGFGAEMSKSSVLLPNLFIASTQKPSIEPIRDIEDEKDEKKSGRGIFQGPSKGKNSEKEEIASQNKKEKEDILDIPAFLRRKRR